MTMSMSGIPTPPTVIPPGLRPLVAATPEAGFPLQNGTPTILSWTAPNDGNLHYLELWAQLDVTVAETGGLVVGSPVFPDGANPQKAVFSAGLGVGQYGVLSDNYSWETVILQPGSTFTLAQTSALTAGAATLWGALYAK